MSKKKDNPQITSRLDKIELALWGPDGRGGIVKDIQEIKSATSLVKTIVVPIAIAVISALITAGILNGT